MLEALARVTVGYTGWWLAKVTPLVAKAARLGISAPVACAGFMELMWCERYPPDCPQYLCVSIMSASSEITNLASTLCPDLRLRRTTTSAFLVFLRKAAVKDDDRRLPDSQTTGSGDWVSNCTVLSSIVPRLDALDESRTFRENKVRKCIDFSPLGKHYPANSGITPAIHRRHTYLLEF